MEFSDENLIRESLAGSTVAFDELMCRYQRLVFKIAFTYTRNRDVALDLTQDVFVKVHRKLATFRTGRPFHVWLARVAANEALNWLRRHRDHLTVDVLPAECTPAANAEQERRLLERERQRELFRRLGKLSRRQRLAVTLRYFEEMPIGELAMVLRCSEGTARNLLFRSLQKMRELKSPLTRVEEIR
ncbi:MAG: RNA polymerase sigma factor [Acidobacteria bacterium]|nr:RNA polymerase sigma factor [Acidobacteriota bacterium]